MYMNVYSFSGDLGKELLVESLGDPAAQLAGQVLEEEVHLRRFIVIVVYIIF